MDWVDLVGGGMDSGSGEGVGWVPGRGWGVMEESGVQGTHEGHPYGGGMPLRQGAGASL